MQLFELKLFTCILKSTFHALFSKYLKVILFNINFRHRLDIFGDNYLSFLSILFIYVNRRKSFFSKMRILKQHCFSVYFKVFALCVFILLFWTVVCVLIQLIVFLKLYTIFFTILKSLIHRT